MILDQTILSILSQNYKPESYKDDKRIKAAIIRTIHELVRLGILPIDEKGKVMNKDIAALDSEPNYSLLQMLESSITALTFEALDEHLVKTIESIDYLGKCWYSPADIAKLLEAATQQRHNREKVRKLLDNLCKEGHCIKMTDKKYNKVYRINYLSKAQ
jgi:hypothetical protein